MRVVPRGVVFRFKGKTDDIVTAANELNVRGIVTGRVLQHKDTLIVKAELVDVLKQNQIWGDQYNRKMDDLLEVQSAIAAEIAEHLQEKLGGSGKRKAQKVAPSAPAVNPEAYRLYLQGVHHAYQWKEDSLRQAIDVFERAISLDSGYAPSFSGLAYTLAMVGFYGFVKPQQAYAQSRAAAQRALTLDPNIAEAYVALAWCCLMFDHDWDEARRQILKAIELKPDLAIAHHGYAVQLTVLRKFDEALTEIEKAKEFDPLTALFQAHHGWILHCNGRDHEALQVLLAAMDVHPNDYYILRIMLYTCKAGGRPDLSVPIGEKAAKHTTNRLTAIGIRAFAYAQAGDQDSARRFLKETENEPNLDVASAYYLSLAYLIIGENDKALDMMEIAFSGSVGISVIVNGEPIFDPLRGNPRFEAMVRRLGLS